MYLNLCVLVAGVMVKVMRMMRAREMVETVKCDDTYVYILCIKRWGMKGVYGYLM